MRYKTSEKGEKWVRRNQDNVQQKKYHHRLGAGGYKSAIPKWENMEGVLHAKGIRPATMVWPKCSRTSFFKHGGILDPETRVCVWGKEYKKQPKDLFKL